MIERDVAKLQKWGKMTAAEAQILLSRKIEVLTAGATLRGRKWLEFLIGAGRSLSQRETKK